MSTTISRRALLASSTGAGIAAITGCSDSPQTTDASQTLKIAIPTDVSFDSIQRFHAVNQPVRRLIFDNLIDKDADGAYHPALAESYEWSSDGTELRLQLRQGVTYHSGRELTPDDIVANLELATKKGSGVQVANLLNRATDFRVDGNAVIITLERPLAALLDALAVLTIVDPETADQLAGAKKVIGTGPYTLESYQAGSKVTLAANKEWWKEPPRLAEVELTVTDNVQASLAALRSGGTDLVQRMLPRDAATLESDPQFTVGTTVGFDVYVGMNTEVQPLSDRRVRQAVAWALDRDRIADQVYKSYAVPSCVPWAETTGGVSQDQVDRYGYDTAKAKAMLTDSGNTGAPVTMVAYAADPAYAAIQEIVQFGLTEAGFQVEPMGVDSATFAEYLQTGTMPGLWVSAVALTSLGPATAIMTANPLSPGKNTANWTDETYAQLAEKLLTAPDDDQRAAATAEVTEYLLEEMFHATVVQARTPWAAKSSVQDVSTDLTLAINLESAHIG